tara:strand:+ start:152 stop:322 length:171 start_codon:yes stop_codon:yes gene_type:complete
MKYLDDNWTGVTLQDFIALSEEELSHIQYLLTEECNRTPLSELLLAKIHIIRHCTL